MDDLLWLLILSVQIKAKHASQPNTFRLSMVLFGKILSHTNHDYLGKGDEYKVCSTCRVTLKIIEGGLYPALAHHLVIKTIITNSLASPISVLFSSQDTSELLGSWILLYWPVPAIGAWPAVRMFCQNQKTLRVPKNRPNFARNWLYMFASVPGFLDCFQHFARGGKQPKNKTCTALVVMGQWFCVQKCLWHQNHFSQLDTRIIDINPSKSSQWTVIYQKSTAPLQPTKQLECAIYALHRLHLYLRYDDKYKEISSMESSVSYHIDARMICSIFLIGKRPYLLPIL